MRLDLPKFGLNLIPAQPCLDVARYALLAERSGFDYVWISDHINHRSAYVCLATSIINTHRIGLGLGITNPVLIHPVMIAQALATFSEMAPGRVMLGIGAGDRTSLLTLGVDQSKPISRVREAVGIIRDLTSGNTVELEGEVFRIRRTVLSLQAQTRIPIFIGAQGPKMLSLAGEIGDGVLINASHPRDLEMMLRYVKEGAKKGGREISDLEVAVATPFSVSEDVEEVKRLAKPIVARVVAGRSNRSLEEYSLDLKSVVRIRDALLKGTRDELPSLVTEDMLELFSIYGTPEQCIERIGRLFSLGVNSFFAVLPIGSNMEASIRLVGRKVLPHFRGKM